MKNIQASDSQTYSMIGSWVSESLIDIVIVHWTKESLIDVKMSSQTQKNQARSIIAVKEGGVQ